MRISDWSSDVCSSDLDPLRDQGRAYAAKLIEAGVPITYREATGNIHGYINLSQAIPSAREDIRGALTVLKAIVAEANGARSEERRCGKECVSQCQSRWSQVTEKKK